MEDIEYLLVSTEDVKVCGSYEIRDTFIQKEAPSYADGGLTVRKIEEMLMDAEDRVLYRFDGEVIWHDAEYITANYDVVLASRHSPMIS